LSPAGRRRRGCAAAACCLRTPMGHGHESKPIAFQTEILFMQRRDQEVDGTVFQTPSTPSARTKQFLDSFPSRMVSFVTEAPPYVGLPAHKLRCAFPPARPALTMTSPVRCTERIAPSIPARISPLPCRRSCVVAFAVRPSVSPSKHKQPAAGAGRLRLLTLTHVHGPCD
jgi:hypothetical protein